jgi:hypothetical protein
MRMTRSLRVCLLLILSITWLGAAVMAQDNQDNEGNPPGRVARLSYVDGNVSFQAAGDTGWGAATLNYPVTTGDRVYTDQGARAELEVGPFAVRLSEATDLTMANLTDQLMQLGLGQGTVSVSIYDLPPGNSVEIDTPNGALTLLQSGSYRVDTDPNGSGTVVSVFSGSLQVSGGGANQTVEGGQAVELTGTESVQVSSVALPEADSFEQWCEDRDRRAESAASAQYVSRDVPGYEDLDQYGRWESAPEYGPVWYPGGVPIGWVPYRFGHWVWVEPWGWTWVEDEPWGFCPFHYGRWAFIGSAWGWVPGPVIVAPVYAPALVAFVGGAGFGISIGIGGGAFAGWFPLGPRDPFFPWYHYGGNYLRQVNITNIRNVTNINTIINVRNVSDIHYAYRTVATTVVPTSVLQNGAPVARQIVRVTPQQLARAEVVPHPEVNPAARAFEGGKPVAAPQIRRVTPPVVAKVVPRAGAPVSRAPVISRSAPPERPAPGNPPAQRFGGPPPTAPPHFITRTPLPPPHLPVPTRQQAMEQHPGRPLEPQQRENLRQGRPAGPQQDKEFPPHAAPHQAEPSHSDKKKPH